MNNNSSETKSNGSGHSKSTGVAQQEWVVAAHCIINMTFLSIREDL